MSSVYLVDQSQTVVVDGGGLVVIPDNAPELIELGVQGPAGVAGADGAAGPGVATGGSIGQYLRKSGNADYATEWATIAISEVNGLASALSGKADAGHTHSISDISGLQTALDGKAPISGTLNTIPFYNDSGVYTQNSNFALAPNTGGGVQPYRLLINNPTALPGEGDSYSALSVLCGDGPGFQAIANWGDQAVTMACAGYDAVNQLYRTRGTFESKSNLQTGDSVGRFSFRGQANGGSRLLGGLRVTYQGNGTTTLSSMSFEVSGATAWLAGDSSARAIVPVNLTVGNSTAGSAGRKLDVYDSSAAQLRLTHTAGSVYADFQANSSGYLVITPSGNRIGIINTPTAMLDIPVSTSLAASVRIRAGTKPSAPNSGDLWNDGSNLNYSDGTRDRKIGSVYTLAFSGVAIPLTGTTAETTLATITIPANTLGTNGRVRITSVWSMTNNANVKTPRIKFGGTSFGNSDITSNASVQDQRVIANRNSVSSQIGPGRTIGGFSQSGNSPVTASVNTAANVDIVFTGQLANSGDTLTLESYLIEIIL